jgi:hypothetical protein
VLVIVRSISTELTGTCNQLITVTCQCLMCDTLVCTWRRPLVIQIIPFLSAFQRHTLLQLTSLCLLCVLIESLQHSHKFQLCFIWNVLYFNCALFELCFIWTVLYLNCVLIEMCFIWTVPYLNCALFEFISFFSLCDEQGFIWTH